MTIHDFGDANSPPTSTAVWDPQRLASLVADVGEDGLRDILRLFMADAPLLQSELAAAVAAGDAVAAQRVLSALQDSAAALGLSALAELARDMGKHPLVPANPERLARELARIRFVPTLKHAS